MRRRVTSLLVPSLLAIALAVAGCGQKGPLYLPDPTPPANPAPAPAPATAAPQNPSR